MGTFLVQDNLVGEGRYFIMIMPTMEHTLYYIMNVGPPTLWQLVWFGGVHSVVTSLTQHHQVQACQFVACLSVGTAPVERSSSLMKLIKIHLRIRISDINLAKLMRIEVEGADLISVYLQQILNIFEGKKISYYIIMYSKSHTM